MTETQSVLAGTRQPTCQQTDLTRAIAGRLANVGSNAAGWTSDEQKEDSRARTRGDGTNSDLESVNRCDRQTGKYAPGTTESIRPINSLWKVKSATGFTSRLVAI